MTTATAPRRRTAPTAEEIRAAVGFMIDGTEEPAHVDRQAGIRDNLDSLAGQAAGPIVAPAVEILEGLGIGGGWEPLRNEPPGLWRDLRPSEALELRGLVIEARDAAVADCVATITARLETAALTFAERHPDATRGTWPPEPVA